MTWYETAFRKEYLDLYYHRDDKSAKAEAEFAVKAMGLPENARVLDIACGGGRHARAMTDLGFRVVGLDLSRDLLASAEGILRVRADMRHVPFDGGFTGATSFFTSFGYFDEEGNRSVLSTAHGALRSGGVYLLDYMNATQVRAQLVAESEEDRDGAHYIVKRRITNDRVEKDVHIEKDGKVVEYTESVRLYLHNDLASMLVEAGLGLVATYGDFDGRDFTTDAPRCIFVARKS